MKRPKHLFWRNAINTRKVLKLAPKEMQQNYWHSRKTENDSRKNQSNLNFLFNWYVCNCSCKTTVDRTGKIEGHLVSSFQQCLPERENVLHGIRTNVVWVKIYRLAIQMESVCDIIRGRSLLRIVALLIDKGLFYAWGGIL